MGFQVRRIANTIAFVALLISPGSFWLSSDCEAQNKIAAPEYDYYSLAVTSISSSAAEASKLSDIPQRVKLLLYAAKILPPSQQDEAIHLLAVALGDIKRWGSEEKATWYQRHTAAELRSDVLAAYAKLDPEKATALQKEFQAELEANASKTGANSLKNETWSAQFRTRRTTADQAARVALSLIDTDPDKALVLVLQSLQGGVVSGVLIEIVQKLVETGNRALLNKLEIGIGEVLAANVTLDPISLSFSSALLQTDKGMPAVTRSAFVSFFMGSLQSWSSLVRDASGNGGLDSSYINAAFTVFSIGVRPALLLYAPGQVPVFDSVMNQLGPLIPTNTRSRLQAFQPETISDPRDRLGDILKDPNPEKRDLRLVRLIFELLQKDGADSQSNLDLASDAVAGFSDPDNKAAFSDLLTITRMNALAQAKKYIDAQRVVASISSEETRAWALLALSTVAAKADRVLGFELIGNALTALDKASPSPHKVELALIATAMLTKNDPERAFATLSAASRYANSSASKVDPPTKPAVAFGLDATIGEAHTRLGVFPESLGEIEIPPSLSLLATTDWFRAEQIANDIREPALRLQLKLQFAEAVLNSNPKPKVKGATTKPPIKEEIH
jgi:hypothetical protein